MAVIVVVVMVVVVVGLRVDVVQIVVNLETRSGVIGVIGVVWVILVIWVTSLVICLVEVEWEDVKNAGVISHLK